MEDKVRGRPIKIDGMAYAPTNEQGVVFLFGKLATRLGFHVEQIQDPFPDCIARRHGEQCRIEFEYRARNYEKQEHPPRGADVVVCWDNDWESRPQKYKHLEIISLRRYVDAKPSIFVVAARKERWEYINKNDTLEWSVPKVAQVGDLIVMYRPSPDAEIRDLWRIVGSYYEEKKWGLGAQLQVVARLNKPITFAELKGDSTTRGFGVVRKRFQGKTDITDDWPLLFAKIVHLNPKAKTKLREYYTE